MDGFKLWIKGCLALITLLACQSSAYIVPRGLRLWQHQIEVSLETLTLQQGSKVKVICDGSIVGRRVDPHLRWYGPDKHWIAYEGSHNRVHVEFSQSQRFLKLHLYRLQPSDSGRYYCRGWLGEQHGWHLTQITINVLPTPTTTVHQPHQLSSSTSTTPPPSDSIFSSYTAVSSESVSSSSVLSSSAAATSSSSSVASVREASATTTAVTRTTPESSPIAPLRVTSQCGEGMVACRNGNGCVMTSEICDGRRQCIDGTDEDPAVCRMTS